MTQPAPEQPRVGTKDQCRHCSEEIVFEPWYILAKGLPNPPVWAHTRSGTKTCSTKPDGWSDDRWPFAEPAAPAPRVTPDELRADRARYRAAWASARRRAQTYGEGILRHVADRDFWMRLARDAREAEDRRTTERDEQQRRAGRAEAERDALKRAHVALAEQAAKDQAAVARLRAALDEQAGDDRGSADRTRLDRIRNAARLHRQNLINTNELYAVIEAHDEPPATDTHHYLSTGCLHGRHDYCQGKTGLTGPKRRAECKFCQAACRCTCHATPNN